MNSFDVRQIKINFIIICAKRVEIEKTFKDFIFHPTKDVSNKRVIMYGYVILSLARYCKLTPQKKYIWPKNLLPKLEKCKPNVVTKSNEHFQSSGYYTSFGNKYSFRIKDGSSLDVYAFKNVKNPKASKMVYENASTFKKPCGILVAMCN